MRHSNSVSHTAGIKRKREADLARNAIANTVSGSYVEEKGATEMHQAISNTLVEHVDKAVEKSPVFALTLDESTDISNMKRLGTNTDDDEIKTALLKDSEIMDGRADTIFEDVKKLMTEKKSEGKKEGSCGYDRLPRSC